MEKLITGIHHVTAIAANAQTNLDILPLLVFPADPGQSFM